MRRLLLRLHTLVAALIVTTTPDGDKDRWRTPPALFAELCAWYGPFALDAAADASNHLCPAWRGPGSSLGKDALAASWQLPGDLAPTQVFCNPPYSRGMVDKFTRRAHEEGWLGHARATLLVPTFTDQPWWRELIWDNDLELPRPGVVVYFP